MEPKWLAKGKALAAFRSAIAGNKELENLVHGFQLSEEEAKELNAILRHLQEHFMAREGVLMERTKFAHIKQEDQESVTAWEGRVKEQGRRLEYCNKCEDQLLRAKFISGINDKRLMSKLLDKCHRDKTTKEIVSFKKMLQVAKNFEQCEKAKAIMQQAKGPTEQVNYTGTKSPSKSEQSWGQGKQAMRMRIQRWSFEVKYKKGAQEVIADTLSRAPLLHISTANLSGEQINYFE